MQQVAPAQAVGQSARAYEVFTPAVERLAAKYPVAASLLYRRIAESILARGSSKQYGYAARDVRHSASLAGRVADDGGIEGHDAFVARLKREHGGNTASGSCSRRNDIGKWILPLFLWSPALFLIKEQIKSRSSADP